MKKAVDVAEIIRRIQIEMEMKKNEKDNKKIS